jgi:hypothetical protein
MACGNSPNSLGRPDCQRIRFHQAAVHLARQFQPAPQSQTGAASPRYSVIMPSFKAQIA